MPKQPASAFAVRLATSSDLDFLREMLFEAAYWRPDVPRPGMAQGLLRPDLAHLLTGWGREGDLACVAESGARVRLGAAWLRFWTGEQHSYGFVDERTPELGLGVRAEARRRGIGTALIAALLAEAAQRGIRGISLSVEKDNPAVHLYQKTGFRIHGETAGAWTMLVELPDS